MTFSGTSKTEYAEIFDRELNQRRASDLLLIWVGGTEQAFRQAGAA